VGRILFLFAQMKMYTTLQTLSEVFIHVYGAFQGDVSPVMWVVNCGSSAANMGVCRGVFSAGVGRILFLFARMKMYTTLQTLSEVCYACLWCLPG
jgi:hypothetical protein